MPFTENLNRPLVFGDAGQIQDLKTLRLLGGDYLAQVSADDPRQLPLFGGNNG